MTLTPHDWRRLRFPIIGLGLALVLIGILVSFADRYRIEHESAMQAQQNLLNQARQKYQSSGMERDAIVQYLPIYNQLLADGFIGEERRIEWIEILRQIHAQHKLFSIDYKISLQENYSPAFLGNLGNFTLHRSVMRLDLEMLHEGDLLTLLDELRAQPTPFIVRDCEMKQISGMPINPNNFKANLKATCEIDWLTLRDPQLSATK
ncbi:MAG TPA: hypothetical protein PLR90_04695 [Methylophilus sp.]|nr:hypothetical protein [Methylophilus sp.]HQQ33196.1 hypothetical protein [Methylophilus sp.]